MPWCTRPPATPDPTPLSTTSSAVSSPVRTWRRPRCTGSSIPGRPRPTIRDRVEAACTSGATSCWVSGIDPGFLTDLLAPVLAGTAVRVDRVTVREIFNYATYHAPHAVRDLVGFGTPMDEVPPMLWPTVPEMVWGGVARLLAEAGGLTLDAVDEVIERRPLDRTIELPIGTFEAGTQGAFRLQVRGLVDGEPVVVVDHVTRIDDECAPDWPYPPERSMGCHQVVLEGDPVHHHDDHGGGRRR